MSKSKDVLFSIILPTYNRGDFISNAILSVLNQDYKYWELIVVDDGSTDNTREIISTFNDSRITYLYKKHEERSIARNYGISFAHGDYICFLDSDDIYYKNHLLVLYNEIIKKEFPVAIFSTGTKIVKKEGEWKRPLFDELIYKHPIYYVWEKFLLINSVCVHSSILESNKFPEKFNVWEDTHLWLRVVAQFPFHQISSQTTQWNVHNNTSGSKSFNTVDVKYVKTYLSAVYDIFENHYGLLSPYFKIKDIRKYNYEKLSMYLLTCYKKRKYITFIKLYLVGLQYADKKKLNRYIYRLVSNRNKQ